jgi:iron complex outermembrane recepter protein
VKLRWAAILVFLGASCFAAAAEPPATRRYDLPAGDAADTLPKFARIADLQLVFPARKVRGIRTNAVHGEYVARVALDRLLDGTGLEAVPDPRTGAYAVRRVSPRPTLPEKLPPPSAPAASVDPTDPVPTQLEAVRVEHRRNFGVTTQSIIPVGLQTPLYHHVVNRAQIERSGVTNMAEFVTTIPGYSGEGAEALQKTADFDLGTGATIYTGSFLKLRGWDSKRTAVLLNGRQLPLSPESRGPDLSRIPLAAVERIEVMPFAGSALYGDGAVGGAMNIVLRKDFSGRSVSLQVGESTHRGAREMFLTWIEGFTSASGRTKATLIGDYQQRAALRMKERNFLARAATRLPAEKALLAFSNAPLASTLRAELAELLHDRLTGSPAVFSVQTGNSTLGIPDKPGAQFALLPAGQDASPLVPSSFTNVDPGLLESRRQERLVLRRPAQNFNLNLQLEHSLLPGRLELYAEAGYSRADEKFSAPDSIARLDLSSLSPINPFRTEVTPGFAGRGVTLHFDPVDLPDARFRQTRDSTRVVLGLRGSPAPHWRWTFDSFADASDTDAVVDSYGTSLNLVLTQIANLTHAAAAAAIYNPMVDHRVFPVSPEIRERFLARHTTVNYRSRLFGANLRADTEPWELPAGPLHLGFGLEYSWHNRTTQHEVRASRDLYDAFSMSAAFASITPPIPPAEKGHRIGGVVEAVVPLFREGKQRVPFHAGELNLASRGMRTEGGDAVLSNTVALKFAPTTSWAVRAAFSQGHVTPSGTQVHGPVTETRESRSYFDPQRGGVTFAPQARTVRGGNPALRPETSQSHVVGLIFTPRAIPGLLVSVDAWSIAAKNRTRAPSLQEIASAPELFPGRLERAPPTPEEIAHGWAGVVTGVDLRAAQVASLRMEGLDFSCRYRLPQFAIGQFTLGTQWEAVRRCEEQLVATSPTLDKVNVVADTTIGLVDSAVVSPRGRATLGWEHGAWAAFVEASYSPPYRTKSTTASAAQPSANGLDGDFIGSSTRWNLQLSHTFKRNREARGVRRWLAGTTWTLGVRNLFDRAPPYRSDGTAFYSRFDDPRLRFIYVRAQWRQ